MFKVFSLACQMMLFWKGKRMGIEQRRSSRPLPGRVTFQSPLAARLDTECLAQAAAAFLVRCPSLCCRGCRRCVDWSSPFVPFLFFLFTTRQGTYVIALFFKVCSGIQWSGGYSWGSGDGGRCAASVLLKFLEFKREKKKWSREKKIKTMGDTVVDA